MGSRIRTRLLPVVVLAVLGCGGREPRTISGKVTARGQEAAGARVELYLEAGRFRTASPFATAVSDAAGNFRLAVPPGSYYLVARRESAGGGRLFAEYSGNPVDVRSARKVVDLVMALEPANSAWEYRGPTDSGIRGKVLSDGHPVDGGFVYVYGDDRSGLIGPGFLTAEPTDPDGNFRIRLAPGTYWVASRLKAAGGKAGFVETQDATGRYAGNPVAVAAGAFVDLGTINLHPADPGRLSDISRGRGRQETATGISGVVVDRGNKAMAGFHVCLYEHPQMIGRPVAVSLTDGRGRFTVNLSRGGIYYLGARQNRSGPRNPGELSGGYEGTPDHAVTVVEGKWLEGLVVRVEEVW